jgi:hypothetical protein
VYTEVRTVLRAALTDFFFNCWCLEIPSDNRIQHEPRCLHCRVKSFRLEAFQNVNVEIGIHFVDTVDTMQKQDLRLWCGSFSFLGSAVLICTDILVIRICVQRKYHEFSSM